MRMQSNFRVKSIPALIMATVFLWTSIFGGLGALPVLAGSSYTAQVTVADSQPGADAGLTFSTVIPKGQLVLKKVILTIPTGYTVSNVPKDSKLGTLELQATDLGLSNYWDISNETSVPIYSGITNDYTYKVSLDSSSRTVTIEAGTGTRSTFPDGLNMSFTLDSGILKNPTEPGTYSWSAQGTNYNNQTVTLPTLALTVTSNGGAPVGGGAVGGAIGGGTLPPVPVIPSELPLNPTPAELEAAKASKEVTLDQETTIQAQDKVAVKVPTGALDKNLDVTIGIGQIKNSPKDEHVVPLDLVKTEREFGPSGTQFQKPVILSFPYSGLDLKGATPDNLAIYYWNPDREDWVKMGGTVDTTQMTVSIPVYHFSTYALMADTHPSTSRLSGTDRFATANAVADQGWASGADQVVLVNAYSFPDALAGTPLANKLNAPILLTDEEVLTPSTWTEIQKLKAKSVTILGGEGVISPEIEKYLKSQNIAVIRLGGVDRYETASLIATYLGTQGEAVIASGEDNHFSDALAISSWAGYHGVSILFAEGSNLPTSTKEALKKLSVHSLRVVGGEGAVPSSVISNAKTVLLSGGVISRYAGDDRYETATAIAADPELELRTDQMFIATGLDFVDALVAGDLAARGNNPLILVDSSLPTPVQTLFEKLKLKGQKVKTVDVGGEGAVGSKIDEMISQYIVK